MGGVACEKLIEIRRKSDNVWERVLPETGGY